MTQPILITVQVLHRGESEPFVAKVLKDGYREKVKLATKLPSWRIKTRADMDHYLNEQLKRLETDVIDFYLLHGLNNNVWPQLKAAGFKKFLDQAMKDGKIRYAGFSFHDKVEVFKEIVGAYDWSFCQIQYNYLDEDFQAGKEGLEYAVQKGLGIVIMEPLRGGNLTRLPEKAKAVMNQVDVKRTPAEWALRWVWNHPEISVVLSGMNAMEQVTENIKVAGEAEPNSLTANEVAVIEAVKQIFKSKVKVNCTGCAYCMPCPIGINIPMCFSAYNDHWVFDGADDAKFAYRLWATLGAFASKCVECGNCESHCPQGIKIRNELKKVVEVFE